MSSSQPLIFGPCLTQEVQKYQQNKDEKGDVPAVPIFP